MYCGSITWNFDAEKNGYVCPQCSAGTGEKTDYELGGGEASPTITYNPRPRPPQSRVVQKVSGMPIWQKIAGGTGILLVAALVVWFVSALFTTHEVRGQVTLIYWERQAHQTVKKLLQGEGFGLPTNATPSGPPISKLYDYEDNIVGYTHGTYTEMSTPEETGHTHNTILIETPGAYYDGPDYDCGPPTEEVGQSVTYAQCHDDLQEDSTWGDGESEETPVYAPQIPVEMTTDPTPVYGTPTPIYKDWYVYTYWEWVTTMILPTTSGNDNNAYWPSGLNDEYHQVVNDSQYYKVVIQYDNGQEKTYDGSDPSLLAKYLLGDTVIGYFNVFNGFIRDNK